MSKAQKFSEDFSEAHVNNYLIRVPTVHPHSPSQKINGLCVEIATPIDFSVDAVVNLLEVPVATDKLSNSL